MRILAYPIDFSIGSNTEYCATAHTRDDRPIDDVVSFHGCTHVHYIANVTFLKNAFLIFMYEAHHTILRSCETY